MAAPEELKYWVALNRIAGLGRVRYSLLQNHFPSMAEAWRAGVSELKAAGLDGKLAGRGAPRAAAEWCGAVVGTRRPTPYGRQAAEEITYGLAANSICVVSGLARGVDSIAHRAALDAGGRTVAVLACGLDIVYPPEHAGLAREIIERGALVSDYPPGTEPRGEFFPRRNRPTSWPSPRG